MSKKSGILIILLGMALLLIGFWIVSKPSAEEVPVEESPLQNRPVRKKYPADNQEAIPVKEVDLPNLEGVEYEIVS